MFGSIDITREANAVTNFFGKHFTDNLLVIDSERQFLEEIEQFYWRQFLLEQNVKNNNLSGLLSAYSEFSQGVKRYITPPDTLFGKFHPVLEGNTLQDVHFKSINSPDMSNTVGLVMAGGLGRRLGKITASTPKPMLQIAGKPVSQHIIEEMVQSGITDVFCSLFHMKQVIKDYYGCGSDFGARIRYLEESQPLGTAGCLSLLPEDNDKNILVVNGDVLTNLKFNRLIQFHENFGNWITVSVRSVPVTIQYGIIESEGHLVTGVTEKPTLDFNINVAIYLLSPDVTDYIPRGIRFDMPELIEKAVKLGKKVGVFNLHEEWIDIGTPNDLDRARNLLNSSPDFFRRPDPSETVLNFEGVAAG